MSPNPNPNANRRPQQPVRPQPQRPLTQAQKNKAIQAGKDAFNNGIGPIVRDGVKKATGQ
jgi:hypothetical protein